MQDKNMLNTDGPARKRTLTPKNRVYIQLICDGVPIVGAYRKAGYGGEPHTAYELKRQLAEHLAEALAARGFSAEGVACELVELSKIPLDPRIASQGLSFDQKLRLIRLKVQALVAQAQRQQGAPRNVTAFVINRNGKDSTIGVNVSDVVDTTIADQVDQVSKDD